MAEAGNTAGKRRIAVFGGGVGSMAAVFTLMQEADWESKYDITIYQMGWRLGGKGASGRNRDAGQRIEEHGLHIWLGFYENAFRMIRTAYDRLDRPEGAPLRAWTDAFKPGSLIVFTENIEGKWKLWPVEFPTNDDVPGSEGVLPHVWDYVHMVLEWMFGQASMSAALAQSVERNPGSARPSIAGWIVEELEKIGTTVAAATGAALLELAFRFAKSLSPEVSLHNAIHHRIILGLLEHFMDWLKRLIEHELDTHDELRRLFITLDIAHAMVRGFIVDGIIAKDSFDVVNDIDLRAWLIRNGASEKYSAWSSPIQGIYDLVFAYERGDWRDPAKANLEAGTGCRGMLRMLLTYKGAIYWKMQAGMGDTIFTPFYEIMRRYPANIHIKFFHQAMSIDSEDGEHVTAVTVFEQARLGNGIAEYDPLVNVLELPCWPSEPRYEQLDPADAAALKAGDIDLESFWTPWKEKAKDRSRTLRRGADFDDVILGIPPAMLAHLLSDRIKSMPRWNAMLSNVKSVQTQSAQLWLKPALGDLGWPTPSPLLGGFAEPLSTWADMSHLLSREQWPPNDLPQTIAYLTGVMEDAANIPPATDHAFPGTQAERTAQMTADWLKANAAVLWPHAVDADGTLKPGLVVSEFLRSNIDPNERYVLSVTNSTKYRLDAGGSGLKNLFLAGDWVRNIINAGCVEAAVIGGMRAARALSGQPVHIIGEDRESTADSA